MHYLIIATLLAFLHCSFSWSTELEVKLQDLQQALGGLVTQISQKTVAGDSAIIATLKSIQTFDDLKKLGHVNPYDVRRDPVMARKLYADDVNIALEKAGRAEKELIKQEFKHMLLRLMNKYYQENGVRKRSSFNIDGKQLAENRKKIAQEIGNANPGGSSSKNASSVSEVIRKYVRTMAYVDEKHNFDYWITAVPGMITKQNNDVFTDFYLMWVDRVEYAISQIPDFGHFYYDYIKAWILDDFYKNYGFSYVNVGNVIFRGANIALYAEKPGDLNAKLNLRLGKSIGLGYLNLFRLKYFDSAQVLGIDIPAAPDGLTWENQAKKYGTNLAQDLETALLKVINPDLYEKNKDAYITLEKSWHSGSLKENIEKDKNTLRRVIDALHRNVDRLKEDYKKEKAQQEPPRPQQKKASWRDKFNDIDSTPQALEAFEKVKEEARKIDNAAADKIKIPRAQEVEREARNGVNLVNRAYRGLQLIVAIDKLMDRFGSDYDKKVPGADEIVKVLNKAFEYLESRVVRRKGDDPTLSQVREDVSDIKGRLREAVRGLNQIASAFRDACALPELSMDKLSDISIELIENWEKEFNQCIKGAGRSKFQAEVQLPYVERNLRNIKQRIPVVAKMSEADKAILDTSLDEPE